MSDQDIGLPESTRLRNEVYDQMTKIEDPGYRAVVALLVRVLDAVEAQTERMHAALSAKIDSVLADERAIKTMVLNGHSDTHDAHHRWIAERMEHDGHCAWAAGHIAEEEQQKEDRHALRFALIEKILIAVLAGAVGLVAPHLAKWW